MDPRACPCLRFHRDVKLEHLDRKYLGRSHLPPSLQGATVHVDNRLENFTDEELEAAATLSRSLESLEAWTPELPATAEPGVHRLLPLAWHGMGSCARTAGATRAEKGGAGGENDQHAEPAQVGQCTRIFVSS